MNELTKCVTGIAGLDEITQGGLPCGRPTLVCGGAGCGKTLFGIEFLLRGATDHAEPGIFVAFEETPEELIENVRSLGFDLNALINTGQLVLEHVFIERSEIDEAGDYDLEGLFVRLQLAIEAVGAKRIVLDTLENLFGGFDNQAILRAELRRLFRWLKERGLTAVITAERGVHTLTRQGLEEYVSDCVILLENRVVKQFATRYLRVVKYRGTLHGTNEYPFLIHEQGIEVLPVTSLRLDHPVSDEKLSTGIPRLDLMLGGEGYYRGSSILVSGTAGTGKSSLAAHFADATCRRGERCLFFAYEEPVNQVVRNMRSIGLNLHTWLAQGLLRFHTRRPTVYGLEAHLAAMHSAIREFRPQVVIVDPISSFGYIGLAVEVKSMVLRLVDALKEQQITVMLTSLSSGENSLEQNDAGISSLIDSWLLLTHIEVNGERNRGLYVFKSRGMPHSNQIREMVVGDNGIDLADIYIGPEGGILIGSARLAQEAREQAERLVSRQEVEAKQRALERKRRLLEAQIAALHSEFRVEEDELRQSIEEQRLRDEQDRELRRALAWSRRADHAVDPENCHD